MSLEYWMSRLKVIRLLSIILAGDSCPDFSRDLEDLSPNLSPTRREALISPPSLVGYPLPGSISTFVRVFTHVFSNPDLFVVDSQ
ncbi:hypothetical protein [Anabaena azotica]|uniref:Uncharacterized protein n=1 Tax=Anabaena azotica FACHB-119 TaxID=947527 RepID=A0ABR8DCM7_9NOST|nr:hypothetical protein [Anabaena azotica]MBD2504723.1 hypothetical protein [Anabaena azotica FACHB-119]